MRYVARNERGMIVAVYEEENDWAQEEVARNDPELLAFVTEGGGEDALRRYLASLDQDMVRVLEDLINVLIDRNLLLLTDFPEGAQHKLLHRQKIREKLMVY